MAGKTADWNTIQIMKEYDFHARRVAGIWKNGRYCAIALLMTGGYTIHTQAQQYTAKMTEEETTDCNRRMREQADSFLRNMPASLQHTQRLAIAKAIGGDCSDLEAVRNSRNTAPEISRTVRTRELSPTARLYEPAAATDKKLPLLIYFHGGGWTFGSINSCGRFCNAMAATGRMKVLAVEYRLAPEYPFPHGLNDCQNAILYAHRHAGELMTDSTRITVGGDSSGGNLAIASALSGQCDGLLASLVLFYPVTKAFADETCSWRKYGEGYALDSSLMNEFNSAYTRGAAERNHLIDVGLSDSEELSRLPKTLLIAVGRDILRDQGIEFAEKAGTDKVTRIEFPEAVHLFITVPGQDEAFNTAVRIASAFITEDSAEAEMCKDTE